MPEPAAEPEPVSVVIPVHNAAAVLDKVVSVWLDALGRIGRGFELILVDDGSPDGTAEKAEQLAARRPDVRLLRHETRRGYGACLRTALAESRHPLVFYTALDYPYTPSDLGKLLERIGREEVVNGRVFRVLVVSGCRTGRPVPGFWRAVGWVYRAFMLFALGNPVAPVPSWLGFREHLRGWIAWLVFGNPLEDVDSSYKLFKREVFDRFPIQSDGDFVHVEVIAKATFTTCMMDEIQLTPNPALVPQSWWREFWTILRNAKFTPPKPPPDPATAPAEVSQPCPRPADPGSCL
jgi:glycosyltransferase involved in cell wall biosynthesis